jgi:exonuclease VII small subunit
MIARWNYAVLVCLLGMSFYFSFQSRKTTEDAARAKVVSDLRLSKWRAVRESQGRIEYLAGLHDSKQYLLESLGESRQIRRESNRAIHRFGSFIAAAVNRPELSLEDSKRELKQAEDSLAHAEKRIAYFELALKDIDTTIAKVENLSVFAANRTQILDTLNAVPDGLRFIPDPAFEIQGGATRLYYKAVNFPASLTFSLSRVGDVRDLSIVVDRDALVERTKLEKGVVQNQDPYQALLLKSIHAVSDLLDTSLQQYRSVSDQAISDCLWKDGKVEIYDGDAAEFAMSRTTEKEETKVRVSFRSQRSDSNVDE